MQIRDALLHPQQINLDAFLPHYEQALPEATSDIAEPPVTQTDQTVIPATLESIPMTKEPAYRRHG